jgi:anti-anti-sigma factor
VLTLRGELRPREQAALHLALLEACQAEALVVVDIGDVTFLDGALAGMFVAAAARVMAYGRHLVVAQAQGQPLRVLQSLGVTYLLTSVRTGESRSLLDHAPRPRLARG